MQLIQMQQLAEGQMGHEGLHMHFGGQLVRRAATNHATNHA